jgi:hypothetical protein
MKQTETTSAAFELCTHVWRASQGATRFAWLRLNQSMRDAVQLAITSGMQFSPDDFERLISQFRGNYWIGCNHELMYAAACKVGNRSACLAYERWQQRRPFLFEGRRIFVGREFRWQHRRVRCTSISQDFLVAVAPKGWENGETERFNYKPDKVFRITREQLKEQKQAALESAA